jgi:hypothetical protein
MQTEAALCFQRAFRLRLPEFRNQRHNRVDGQLGASGPRARPTGRDGISPMDHPQLISLFRCVIISGSCPSSGRCHVTDLTQFRSICCCDCLRGEIFARSCWRWHTDRSSCPEPHLKQSSDLTHFMRRCIIAIRANVRPGISLRFCANLLGPLSRSRRPYVHETNRRQN